MTKNNAKQQSPLTLGIFSPAWWQDESVLQGAKAKLESLGFGVILHPQNALRDHGQVAGTPQQRCEALYALLENPAVDAIMCAGGGYGALQMLTHLDYARIAQSSKPLIGYSDVTALLNAIYAQSGKVSLHGEMPSTLMRKPHPLTDTWLVKGLTETFAQVNFAQFPHVQMLQAGRGEGVLLGGNMTVFDQLIGTPFLPQPEHVLLLLEDAGEKINELDKKLLHLSHIGYLSRVRGLILAGAEDLGDNDKPFGFSVAEIVARYLPRDIPVVSNTPCGHGAWRMVLPIGQRCRLENAVLSAM